MGRDRTEGSADEPALAGTDGRETDLPRRFLRRSPSMGISHDEKQDDRSFHPERPRRHGRHALRDQEVLWADFLAMARTVVDSLAKSIEALCEGRLELIPEVKGVEEESDREEVRIEQECLRDPGPLRAGRLGPAPTGDHPEGQSRLGADRRPGRPDRPTRPQVGQEVPGRHDPRAPQGDRPRRARPGPRQLRRPGRARRRAAPGPSSRLTARSTGNTGGSARTSRKTSACMPASSTPGSS